MKKAFSAGQILRVWLAGLTASAIIFTAPQAVSAASSGTAVQSAESAEMAESGTEPVITDIDSEFYISEITDEIFERIRGKSYREDCTVPREDLRYLHVLHKDVDGNILRGELICNKAIADDLAEILRELFEADYPIEKIRLVDEYDAVDESSMADNNTSSFNFRLISHSSKVSKHGLGLAIDINPLYNPSTKSVDGEWICEPDNGWDYLDREAEFPYKIEEGDLCLSLFKEHGFRWGGDWIHQKDYQHFELPDDAVGELYPGMGY